MSQNGPFGDDDKTVLRPSPGGRLPEQPTQNRVTPTPQAQPVAYQNIPVLNAFPGVTTSSLLALSAGILSLAARLRVTVSYAGVDELKQRLAKEISEFENRALSSGIQQEQARMASYGLCTFLDEVIQNTPWGSQSNWGHQSLLILFHKEAWGGERFFQILEHLVKQPAQNLNLIEFCYVLLSFGFEGKYRVMTNGVNELEKQRLELFQLIQRVKGDFPPELSPRWQGQKSAKNTLMSQVPLWVFATIAGGLLLLCYLGFAFLINSASDPAYKELLKLAKEPIQIAAAQPVVAPAVISQPSHRAERFKPLLRDEISRNMVEVVDDSIIRIRNSFASGSDQVKPEFIPMVKKIAKELENQQDSILVTGHTDDKPIVSARFPSNWHLSTSRAKNVLTILTESAHLSGTVRAEGRADGEPLEPNDNAEHRAFNRRVDILIK
ncbi:type IVB secretion system protein IcmH/DotU [Methylomonas montana]|uniref:type IVB secretion system protein IcmH/DotU n=1 Tax=Methylomonas montana TaxID=3058963 RepID=UPI002659B301|nr:type IVB secretion system protein IcmH/DotU [Methylomonas montana]WKJ90866.1 type IVB secretion system protein IcmH/DotU [Methylomonas montana]